MTAQQARELLVSNQKDMEEIYKYIANIAKGGQSKAVFKLNEIRNPDEAREELEKNGFDVKIELDTYFTITF